LHRHSSCAATTLVRQTPQAIRDNVIGVLNRRRR